ncbi:MAG: site-2 protease family protein [Candidatus Aenigmarchaeota archaeon]|nr:site-2 protease family protein [Candidatus Aenigmarchaeota archaeon]
MDWYLASFLIFIGIVAILIYAKREKITNRYYIFYRYDTKKGIKLIDKIARWNPKFWRYFGSFGVFVGFCAMFFGIYYILNSYVIYFTRPQAFIPSVSLVIPVPFENLTFVPGFLGVPFWYWLIPITILVFFHEGMHGIMARVEKIRIKTLGLFLLTVIPGAFVEPDEKQLKKANWKAKMRIFAAGSNINILIGLFFIFLLLWIYLPHYYDDSLGFSSYTILENKTKLPAQLNNLTGAIYSVNGERVRSIHDLAEIMNKTKPGDIIEIRTVKGNVIAPLFNVVVLGNERFKDYKIKTANIKGRAIIGIASFYDVKSLKNDVSNPDLINFLTGILIWMSIINIGVGVINMLPIKPLDGGLMIEALSERFSPHHKDKIVKLVSTFFLLVLIGDFLMGFL